MPPAAPDLRDIKPLVELPHGPPYLAVGLALLAIAIVVAAAYWLASRRRRRRAAPAAPPEPADAVALRWLTALARDHGEGAEAARRFHFAVSQVLRAYVEARLDLNATDLTTDEIQSRLEHHDDLGGELRRELVDLLRTCDAVKYTRTPGTRDDCQVACERARRFVLATRSRPQPPAPAAGAATTGAL